jgi:nitronate monooxygenase
MTLVPQVVDAVAPLPALAGGGIADRRGVRAAIELGAVGVWVGTRFLAAEEADIHPAYRDRVLASSAMPAPWPSMALS